MKVKLQIAFIPWRFYLLSFFILLIVAGLIVRLVQLAVIDRSFLLRQGNVRSLRVVTVPAFRGMITDRNGYPLAISTTVFSVWVNPKEFLFDSASIEQLSERIGIKPGKILSTIARYKEKNKEFVYLKRELSPALAKQIKSLAIPGVYLQQDYKRFYPEGEISAHVIGFTNVDDKGQEGLELAYNKWLSGMPGKKQVVKDRIGRIISEIRTIQPQQSGNDLTLSINRRIQYVAYRELMAGVQQNVAESGTVIVLNVKTGEILAMVNQPSFNPNNIAGEKKSDMRNRAVTDLFEPGSTIKTFSLATALASGLYKPDTIVDTYPGWIRVGHNLVRDEHRKGPMTVAQILQYSSNVGVTKIMLSLPPNVWIKFWNLLAGLGFGEPTNTGYPGEQAGRLIKRAVWKPFAMATLSFGYGLSVTPLQLAHAYATIANDGVKIPLALLKQDKPPTGVRVMDKKLARLMLSLMEGVVQGGTAEVANIPGYRIAGKTGTSHIVGPHGYEKHQYMASFVGIAPASNPQIVVAVIIRNPQGKVYMGGDVAAPIFKKIMESTIRILNIPPDNLTQVPA